MQPGWDQLCAHCFPTSTGIPPEKNLRPLSLAGFPLFGVTQLLAGIPGPEKIIRAFLTKSM